MNVAFLDETLTVDTMLIDVSLLPLCSVGPSNTVGRAPG